METNFDKPLEQRVNRLDNSTFTQPTPHANITIVSGGYIKIGSLVVVNVVFTASSEIANWTNIFTNLPTAVNYVPCKCTNHSNTDQHVGLYEIVFDPAGSIVATSGGSRKISTTGTWELSCVYISNQ